MTSPGGPAASGGLNPTGQPHPARESVPLLAVLQHRLETIYELAIPHAVQDFLVTDERTARALDASEAPRSAAETLYIRESADSLDVSLYVDESIVQRLLKDNPTEHLHPGNFADFCVALEGVSHFVYLIYNASYGRSVSLLELELQAEVDKFAAAAFIFGKQNAGRVPAWLHEQLFTRARFDDKLDRQGQLRYRAASDYAARYCGRLSRRYLRGAMTHSLINDLRRFYRLTHGQKIRSISTKH